MKYLTCVTPLILVVVSMFASSVCAGEIRVLLRFDNAGHHVVRVVRSDSETINSSGQPGWLVKDGMPDLAALASGLKPSVATLLWADAAGLWHASSNEPDPRVSHSPAHISGAHGSRFSEQTGAWLVSGPENAVSLAIFLPANPSLGLGFEQWEVLLTRN